MLKKLPALLLCLALTVLSFPLAVFADGMLLEVDSETVATNTENAFIGAGSGMGGGGISLKSDYGSDGLSVALIDRKQDKFIIELNGNTLTLGYLALNMDLEVRGEGTLSVSGGIVIYSGQLRLGDGVRLCTQSDLAVIAHGEHARVCVGENVVFVGSDGAVAEIGIRYEYKETPIIFEKYPSDAIGLVGGTAGVDYIRVLYENCYGDHPAVSTAQAAQFPTEMDAESALSIGYISVVNPLDGTETEATDDDSFLKAVGNAVTVGKSGAILSHANLSLDGELGVNLYFELSGLEGSVEALGALLYSGVGDGGRIEIPEKNSDGKYRFKVPITPMDMRKVIKVRFEGDESGKVWEYSVEKYARYILSDTEGVFADSVKDLIASMLNYGSAMQILNGQTEELAGDILSEFERYGDREKISAKITEAVEWLYASGYGYSDSYYADGENSPVKFNQMSLSVNESTAIKIYLAEGYPTDGRYSYHLTYQNISSNGSVYEKTETLNSDGITEKGYVEISGISASEFDRVFRISVKHSGTVIASCEFTVLWYALGLYNVSEDGSAERALSEALIWYGAQSVTYF